MLPLITRELRAEARRPWNYWLRLLAGAVVTSVFAFAGPAGGIGVGAGGGALFGTVSWVLYCGIWLLSPLLTADCLSREKREGTLGLLFLTPLKPREIVLGKSIVHFLRATSFLFAALPVITIPLLIGGVSAGNVVQLFIGHLASMLLALSAGLLASAFAREWIRAVLLSAIFAFAFFLLQRLPVVIVTGVTRAAAAKGFPLGGVQAFLFTWMMPAALWLLPVVVFGAVVLIAQRRLRLASLDESLSKRKLWWLKTFCQPVVWKERFRASMSRTLTANPIGWLQEYSWSARLTKWGWCFLVIVTETHLVTTVSWTGFQGKQQVLAFLFSLGMAFTAAGSFRRERQTGALELILVTPLKVDEIIFGRLKGIWSQFLPAALIFVAAVWFGRSYFNMFRPTVDPSFLLPLVIVTFFTLPVFGLHSSLKYKSFIAAWAMTCVTTFVAWILSFFLSGFGVWLTLFPGAGAGGSDGSPVFWVVGAFQIGCAWVVFQRLRRDLANRTFPLQQSVS